MSKISERLNDALQKFVIEEEKAANGNRSARVRARGLLMQIKQIAADGRKQLSPSNPSAAAAESEAA